MGWQEQHFSLDKLQILQNKGSKIIFDAPYLSSSTEALSKLNWLPLTHRRYLHRMLTIYKLVNNLTELSFKLPKTNHLYNSRRRDDIYLGKSKTNGGKQKLFHQACKEYNALDHNVKSISEIAWFRNILFGTLYPWSIETHLPQPLLALSFNIKLAWTILVLFALLVLYLFLITAFCMRIL